MRHQAGTSYQLGGAPVEGAVPPPDPVEVTEDEDPIKVIYEALCWWIKNAGGLISGVHHRDKARDALYALDQIQQGRDASPRGLAAEAIQEELSRWHTACVQRETPGGRAGAEMIDRIQLWIEQQSKPKPGVQGRR